MQFLIMVAISIAISLIAYLLAPKPKQPKPEAARELESPTAEAGRPVPVVFGTVTVKGVNIMWTGDKSIHEYQVSA
jgi:predicted phage tail protein